MKNKLFIMVIWGSILAVGCQTDTAAEKAEKALRPAQRVQTTQYKKIVLDKNLQPKPVLKSETRDDPLSEEANVEIAELTLIQVSFLAQMIDCLTVNELNIPQRNREIAALFKLTGVAQDKYNRVSKLLNRYEKVREELVKAKKQCRMTREQLMSVLVDSECVRRVYQSVGFREVPRPLNKFYLFRNSTMEFVQMVQRRFKSSPEFQSELKKRIGHCPDYDLKKLRNRQGEVCLQDEHCLAHLKCHKSSPAAGEGWKCLTDSDIAARKQQAESEQNR